MGWAQNEAGLGFESLMRPFLRRSSTIFLDSDTALSRSLSTMAAIRKAMAISSSRRLVLPSLFPPPSRLLSFRGIASKLFVGGLPFHTTDQGLSDAFSQYGQVVEATVVMNKVTNKSKGFGFVAFASEDEARTALTEMNGKPLNGRVIFVDYAKPTSNFRGEIPIARGPPEEKTDE